MGSRDGDEVVDRLAEIVADLAMRYIERYLEVVAVEQRAILTAAICGELAGRRIPKGTAARRSARDAAIRAAHAKGADVAELSAQFHLGRSQVSRVLKGSHGKLQSD